MQKLEKEAFEIFRFSQRKLTIPNTLRVKTSFVCLHHGN